jgi:hypothetical protein
MDFSFRPTALGRRASRLYFDRERAYGVADLVEVQLFGAGGKVECAPGPPASTVPQRAAGPCPNMYLRVASDLLCPGPEPPGLTPGASFTVPTTEKKAVGTRIVKTQPVPGTSRTLSLPPSASTLRRASTIRAQPRSGQVVLRERLEQGVCRAGGKPAAMVGHVDVHFGSRRARAQGHQGAGPL